MKNILFISPASFLASAGGVERYLLNLVDYSRKQQHTTVLVIPSTGNSFIKSFKNLIIFGTTNLSTFLKKEYQEIQKITELRSLQTELLNLVKEYKIEAVCVENLPSELAINELQSLTQIPFFLQLHSYIEDPLAISKLKSINWEKIICISRSVEKHCLKQGIPAEKLVYNNLGVNRQVFFPDTEERKILRAKFGIKDDETVVMLASRIICGTDSILKEKGILRLITAVQAGRNKGLNLKLFLSLARPQLELTKEFEHSLQLLKTALREACLDDYTIIQSADLHEMPKFYRIADIFVLPSQSETLGQVILEALASGALVAGSNVGGIPEIIVNDSTGLLIEPDTAIEDLLERIIKEPGLHDKFTRNTNILLAEKFDLNKQLNSLFEILSAT